MGADELRTLLNIYMNPDYEDEGSIKKNIEEAGIDVVSFIEQVIIKLEKAKAERRLAEGEQFKQQFYTYLDNGESEREDSEIEGVLSFGFRNREGEMTEEELEELEKDKSKLKIIKKLTENNERNSKG